MDIIVTLFTFQITIHKCHATNRHSSKGGKLGDGNMYSTVAPSIAHLWLYVFVDPPIFSQGIVGDCASHTFLLIIILLRASTPLP